MFWIIHGHEITILLKSTIFNSNDAADWLTRWWALFTFSSSVSVDTFFFLGGILLMYGFLNAKAKKIPFDITVFYIHRYLRLTPAYAAVIILYMTFFIKLGTGPNWKTANQGFQNECKEYWWSSLLYIQNFVNPENRCISQTWYLSVDMQLYILSPLILIPIGKWPKITPYFFVVLVVLFTVIPTWVAWHFEIPALAMMADIPNWHFIYYAQVHTRAGPWIIGLVMGYILFQTKHKKCRMNKIIVSLLWFLTAVVMLYIIFGNYPALDDNFHYSKLYNSLFIGLHRNLWALGLSWIVFACIHGYGGPVNWILSLSVFQFLAKITYCLYLIHKAIQYYNRGIVRVPIIFSNYTILKSFFSTTCLSILIAIIWVLCFEAPFVVIDGVITKAVLSLWKKATPKKELKQET
ncbi:O-acyltransferase like protein-like [Chrysoperla carnea]|uniref:O-acyltransferase like protein-like n=1 Tax=Chrysoperla carnea TaxID=189513 RepID=UPI001D094F4C|nr:O-acyltransferase like protein-like [Chrysoperla carnea]